MYVHLPIKPKEKIIPWHCFLIINTYRKIMMTTKLLSISHFTTPKKCLLTFALQFSLILLADP